MLFHSGKLTLNFTVESIEVNMDNNCVLRYSMRVHWNILYYHTCTLFVFVICFLYEGFIYFLCCRPWLGGQAVELPLVWKAVTLMTEVIDRRYLSKGHRYLWHDDVIKWKKIRVTGHLCGEITVDRWIPLTKASDAELWCFLWPAPE